MSFSLGCSVVSAVPTTLAGEGLLGARHRGSSVSDGLRRWLWHRVVVSSSESECCELLYPSELRVVFCKSSRIPFTLPPLGLLAGQQVVSELVTSTKKKIQRSEEKRSNGSPRLL
ncbi:hypothetical protein Taro_005013 [Colocasia esculenta]|uniref:Uncharacterized protein n=1 Tax=Colocasia esculenta TaxID=4460 RepID=A0A843TLW2_COLES|nr:hypothetical protein [Colocasia esculenta]